jgi:hypothetical protein
MRITLSDAPLAQCAGNPVGDVGNFADCIDLDEQSATAVYLDEWRGFAGKKLKPSADHGFIGVVRATGIFGSEQDSLDNDFGFDGEFNDGIQLFALVGEHLV